MLQNNTRVLVGSAVLGDVTELVTVVAAFVFLRTVTGKMPHQVALETTLCATDSTHTMTYTVQLSE